MTRERGTFEDGRMEGAQVGVVVAVLGIESPLAEKPAQQWHYPPVPSPFLPFSLVMAPSQVMPRQSQPDENRNKAGWTPPEVQWVVTSAGTVGGGQSLNQTSKAGCLSY